MSQDVAQLWAQLAPELTSYFERLLPSPAEAEDFVSETFARLIGKDDAKTPEKLLWVIAKGLLYNEYRDKASIAVDFETREWPGVRERGKALELALNDEISDLESGFVPSVEDQFFATQHDEVVRGLDDELRDAYILGELRGLVSREAAPLLGVSHATANTRRELATTSIREELSA